MKSIFVLSFFLVGAMANTVSISYGTAMNSAPVISYGSPAPAARIPSYAASAPVIQAPVVQAPVVHAPVVQAPVSYAAPAAPVVSPSYESSSAQDVVAPQIPITRYNHEMHANGHSSVEFETGHGIRQSEVTQVRLNPNHVPLPEDENHGGALVTKTGSVSYTSPEGQQINLQYVADETGFHPVGDHLPTPPPVPADIQAALRQLEAIQHLQAAEGNY